MRLLCLCGLITRFDFWALVLTGISTIAVIVIAFIQIKMQKQQIKMQKQESYKDIYKLIQSIHYNTDSLFYNITLTLSSKHYDNFSLEYLTRRKLEFSELMKMFGDSEDEIRLKLGASYMQHLYYRMLLISAHEVVDTIINNINYIEFVPHNIEEDVKLTDDKCIDILIDKVAKDKQSTSKYVFDYFVKMKNCVAEHSLLDVLKKHCK